MSVRRIFWDPPTDADLAGHKVYIDAAGTDLFAKIKNKSITPTVILALGVNEYLFDDEGVTPGDYQFAVTAFDDSGNESDPYQHPDWAVVTVVEPPDTTPPSPPTGGGIEFVS